MRTTKPAPLAELTDAELRAVAGGDRHHLFVCRRRNGFAAVVRAACAKPHIKLDRFPVPPHTPV